MTFICTRSMYVCALSARTHRQDLLAPATLAAHVQSVLTYACAHVYECRLCACKGYICELCNHAQVVYPFEMDTTYRVRPCLAPAGTQYSPHVPVPQVLQCLPSGVHAHAREQWQ